jgi:hypothetical protein
MTLEDYIISLLLISVVVRQMWGRRLTIYGLVWPVALVVFLGSENFKGVPTSGNDIPFIIFIGAIGATLGILCGVFTKVKENKKGVLIAKATSLAAALWIIGTSMRVIFALYVTHGGASNIARFSNTHDLSGISVWVCALLLMALAEVLGRTVVLLIRAVNYRQSHAQPAVTHDLVKSF